MAEIGFAVATAFATTTGTSGILNVKVSGVSGSTTVSSATITVNPALGIGTQPSGATIDNGQSDLLSVTASNGTTPYSYQWYIGASGTTTSPIGGATSSTFGPTVRKATICGRPWTWSGPTSCPAEATAMPPA